MIIGIAGKAGSGKDLVGSIIQYLIACKKYEGMDCFNADYVNKGFDLKADYANITEWKIKKFADKLKDCVCLLIGCNREDLENHTFKEEELGEEWWKYETGHYSIGKYYGIFSTYGEAYNFLINQGLTKEDIEDYDKYFEGERSSIKCLKLTPRKMLQLLGTECGRQIVHPDIWVNATMSEYKPRKATLISKDCPRQDIYSLTEEDEIIYGTIGELYPNWIITDVRFPNELEAIKKRKGITIRINRGLIERTGKMIQESEHISETALNNAEFDYVIENDGTIEELLNKVRKILIKEKII